MNSEIEQLKKEIAQLKEENRVLKIKIETKDFVYGEYKETAKRWEEIANKLRSRYVPDIEEYQETLIVKIDEDAENYYLTFSCSNNPKMKDKKNSKDGKTFYIKNLPSAEFFISYARSVYKYLEGKSAIKISSKKYSIPKSVLTISTKNFIYEIRSRFEDLKDSFGWYSQYDKVENRFPPYVKQNEKDRLWNSEKGCLIYSLSCDCDNIDESDSEREDEDIYMKKRVEDCKFYKHMIEIQTNMKKTN